jgi:RimJ/RimL family protein N-acetyltransferase
VTSIRILTPGDEALLDAFLRPRIASSMILLSNLRAAGLHDRGERFEGTYAVVFEANAPIGVVAMYWNGNAILQAPPAHAAALCKAAMGASGRALAGMLGPAAQVAGALGGLGIEPGALRLDSVEGLFELSLDRVRVPTALADGTIRVRAAAPEDLELLAKWRSAYMIEALYEPDTPQLYADSLEAERRGITDGHIWLAQHDGRPAATTGFNAVTREAVQVGGVYTPPELRGRGYARAAVAQSLLDMRMLGIERSLLFTGDDNPAAQRAYQAIGFQRIGDYRIAMLAEPLVCGL